MKKPRFYFQYVIIANAFFDWIGNDY